MHLVTVLNDAFTQENTYVECFKNTDGNKNVDHYVVVRKSNEEIIADVKFQHGPIKEAGGVNGLFNEDLLLMIIDRLETWQKTKFACAENEEAIKHLYNAVAALRARTERRRAEGTLGTWNESQKAHDDVLNAIASGLENPSIAYPMDNPKDDDNTILK